jgi:hypothetical protein
VTICIESRSTKLRTDVHVFSEWSMGTPARCTPPAKPTSSVDRICQTHSPALRVHEILHLNFPCVALSDGSAFRVCGVTTEWLQQQMPLVCRDNYALLLQS